MKPVTKNWIRKLSHLAWTSPLIFAAASLSIFSSFSLRAHANEQRCEALFSASPVHESIVTTGDTLTFGVQQKIQTILEIVGRDGASFFEAHELAQKMKQTQQTQLGSALSDNERREWYQAIAKLYPSLDKRSTSNIGAPGTQRIVTFALTLFERYDLKFITYAKALDPWQAYEQFLNQQKDLFGSRYGIDELEVVALTLRERLIMNPQNSTAFEKLWIGGSFVNGKAIRSTSDIDIAVGATTPPPSSEQVVELQTLLSQNARLSAVANLPLSFYSMNPMFFGRTHPFLIEVTANELALYVFPPARLGMDGFVLSTEVPTRFVLRTFTIGN